MGNKTIHCIAVALLLAVTASCGSSKEFACLKDSGSIEVIHVPRSLGFIAGTAIRLSGEKEAASMLKGFRSLDVISCGSSEDRRKVYATLDETFKNDRSELILEVNGRNEKTRIYGIPDTKSKKIRNVTIITEEGGEMSVVRAKGSFNIDSLVKDMD